MRYGSVTVSAKNTEKLAYDSFEKESKKTNCVDCGVSTGTSPVSDLSSVFQIDLRSFVTRLRQLKQRVQAFDRGTRISTQLENQALWLEQMSRVVAEMKLTVRHLKTSVDQLQEHLRFNHSSLRYQYLLIWASL